MKGYVVNRSVRTGVELCELAAPSASAGVAVVSVAATSLNRGEVQHVRSGVLSEGARAGWDFAGTIKFAATDGTSPAQGARVFGWCMARGTWAEEVAVRSDHLAIAPDALSSVDACTLGVAALTALAASECYRGSLTGRRALVTGATGGVGIFALQLAHAAGADVAASVRHSDDADFIADVTQLRVPCEVGLDPHGVPADLIIESVGGEILSSALRRVAANGTVVSLGRTMPNDSSVRAGWFLRNARLDVA